MTDKKKPPQIDTAALLDRVDIVAVINAHVPLTKNGAEYEACCPFHTEATPSFKVNPAKRFYHCFGCGVNGDAIKFLVEYQGLSFVDACRELGADVPENSQPATPKKPRKPANKASAASVAPSPDDAPEGEWMPILPVPADAPPPPVAHSFRGKPSHTWTYHDAKGRVLGYTCRFEKSSGDKVIIPLTWCRHSLTGACDWKWISFPAEPPGRPLYGLDRLAAKPDATVLVVEGEKCADAAQEQLPELVVVSWPGGGKAVDKSDWSPLAARKVMGWADCDAKRERLTPAERKVGGDPLAKPLLPEEEQPGVMAMAKVAGHVLALGCRYWDVKIPAPGAKPDGWDIADAIAEGLTGSALADFLRAKENRIERLPAPASETPPDATQAGAGEEKERVFVPGLIYKKGELASCLWNVYQILALRDEWHGVVAYDQFSLCVVKRKEPPYTWGCLGEWDATDDSRCAMWLSREYNFTPSSALIAEAVEVLARANAWHPVRTWLHSLAWDGVPRLTTWLTDYLGVAPSEYTARVAKWWIMGAVYRVMFPGCKFDYCLVLQGPQGKGKSTALAVIGGEWFGDTDLDLSHKDSMSALRGKLVYEIAELGALMRSEEKRQKSFLSRRVDEYRPVYGRREIKAPRQLVFGGSTNDFEWNKDPTGGRRFWPVMCEGELDLDGLREIREQMFAEALVYVRAEQRCYPTAAEQKALFDPEQLRVEQQDSLVDLLHDWVYLRTNEFSIGEAALDGLKLDASKLTRDLQTRIGIALRKLGCARFEKRNGMTRFWYKPPERNAAKSETEQPAQQGWMGSDDDVLF